ncbi:hypothetical protein [Kitasatospora sp. A2-31]|uniref:hypothetical protein n=1 Tax=Kitasatospora sp. A2-31 TaxID=2916414 RepID=UPI001EEE85B9|nr:hypothetical protein [Kitasatospora sp. A2-31]MCG6499641.1 hypothetical protein [Kitasatospora sp. A2-31]
MSGEFKMCVASNPERRSVAARPSGLALMLGLAGLLMSGCSAGGSSFEASQDDILGTWTNQKGAHLVIESGGTFRSERIIKVVSLRDGCAQALTVGKWLLMGDQTHVASSSDPKGSTISLMPSGDRELLACSIEASVKKDGDGINLCLVKDPDQTCGDEELLRKASTG